MIWNYIKTGLRSFLRKPIYASLNVVGLAVGLASFLIIIAITKYEESFDNHVSESKHLVSRIIWERSDAETKEVSSYSQTTMFPFSTNFKERFGEDFKHYTTCTFTSGIIEVDETKIEQDDILFADNAFLEVFRCRTILGNQKGLLKEPNTIVLTQTIAEKFFGNESPLGKIIEYYAWNYKGKLEVTGVIEDFPVNTTFRAEALISLTSVVGENSFFANDEWADNWVFWNFLAFESEAKKETVLSQLPSFAKEIKPLVNDDNNWRFFFQPIEEMRFNSDFQAQQKGNNTAKLLLNTIKIIGLLIILISWVNFINMATATAITRAREIGARKAIGAVKKDIIIQFFIEAILYNVLALLLALGLMTLVAKPFVAFIQADYTYEMFFRQEFLGYLIVIVLIGIVCSGFYPSLVLSSFQPRVVMNTKKSSSKGSNIIRKWLVGLQFFISLAMLIGTGILIHQTWYLNGLEKGVDIENVLAVNSPVIHSQDKVQNTYRDFVRALKDLPMVENASASTSVPSRFSGGNSIRRQNLGENKGNIRTTVGIDENYFDLYNIPFVVGEGLRSGTETQSMILSDKARISLKYEKATDVFEDEMNAYLYDYRFKIKGVVKDYKHNILQRSANENGMVFIPLTGIFKHPEVFSIKFHEGINQEQGIAAVKAIYDKFYPDDFFKYDFIEDSFKDLLEGEKILERLFLIFSTIAFVLLLMGIMGLSSFMANMRSSEIAVRKVLGANLSDVLKVMSREFVVIFSIACVVVIPAIWYFMNQWLQSAYYRIDIGIQHFILPMILVLGITLLVVLYNTLKVFRIHPSKVLG